MGDSGIAGEISADAGNGDREILRAAGSAQLGAPAGVGVIDVKRIGVIAAERGAVDDVEGIGIGGPGSGSTETAKGRGRAAGGAVEIKNVAYLIVDEYLVAIRSGSQHYARRACVLPGDGIVGGGVDHELARRAEIEIASELVHDHRVGHVGQTHGRPWRAREELNR